MTGSDTRSPDSTRRRDASWAGATLGERLAHLGRAGVAASAATGDEALMPWARACAFGSMDGLRRRLSWDGIDAALARAALTADTPADFPVAPWIDRVSEIVTDARACAPLVGTAEWEAELTRVGGGSPFADAWLPVVRVARRRLALAAPVASTVLADPAMSALERHLVRELARLGELTLLEDLRAQLDAPAPDSDAGYLAWIRQLFDSRAAELFITFPVLARHVVLLSDQWVDQIVALVSRVEGDRAVIEATFGLEARQITGITPGLSDRHAGGQRVAKVEFASGLRLAYKPRDVRLERRFNDLLSWLQEAGLAVAPPRLRVIDRGVIDRETAASRWGWCEWVEQEELASVDAVRAYFRATGALIALTHVLGGTDLHSENLVASARGPGLVDTEMLLQPSTKPSATDDEDPSSGLSCLAPGLVSFFVVDRTGRPFDVGGLRPAPARELNVPMRRWLDLRRDAIRFVPEARVHPTLRNDVRLAGVIQRPEDFVDEVCAGFESTWRFLDAHRAALVAPDGPLSGFAECRVRLLFRPSDEYASAQYLLAAPRYQRRGLDRSVALEMFNRVFAGDVERPRLWPLVNDARPPLEALDIPRPTLRAASRDLESEHGEVVEALYAQSGLEAVRGRLATLSADDLAWQIDQLRTALGSADGQVGAAPRDDDRAGDVLQDAAERVGRLLLARAEPGPDDSLRWASSKGRVDLYSGAGGIGLFLAALAAVTGRDRWADASRRVWRGVEAGVRAQSGEAASRMGACTGRPSVAYAWALSGRLLGESDFIERAGELAAAIPAAAIAADTSLDIEGGVGGTLVALISIYEVYPDDRLGLLAGQCLSRLGDRQLRDGPERGAWRCGASGDASDAAVRPLPGFAHGAAGIAAAICRWAAAFGDRTVARLVHEAWGFERRLYAEQGDWPAITRDGGRVSMTAWCHGAPGIALARALAPASIADDDVATEIEAAMGQTISKAPAPLDHLCCGNLGRADVALTVGLLRGEAAWIDAGTSMARTVAERIVSQGRIGMRGKGFNWGAPGPELFQGVAGIGYQLLRAASPSLVPSVLAFEMRPTPAGTSSPEAVAR